jgi:hypothetical protein
VAALTMPALVADYKKRETVTRLQKAYSTINQAMKLSEVDNGAYAAWETGLPPIEYLEKYWFPYFKVNQICNTAPKCGYTTANPWTRHNGTSTYASFSNVGRIPFLTTDNILYSVSVAQSDGALNTDAARVVIIDINGAQKPNIFGEDVFFFIRTADGSVKPYGYDLTDQEINENCTPEQTMNYCAAKIIKDGWVMDYL